MVSRCFPGGYNVKLYISRGRLAWWLLAFLHSVCSLPFSMYPQESLRISIHLMYYPFTHKTSSSYSCAIIPRGDFQHTELCTLHNHLQCIIMWMEVHQRTSMISTDVAHLLYSAFVRFYTFSALYSSVQLKFTLSE